MSPQGARPSRGSLDADGHDVLAWGEAKKVEKHRCVLLPFCFFAFEMSKFSVICGN